MRNFCFALCGLLAASFTTVWAQEPTAPSVEPVILQAAEDKYSSEVTRAEAELAKVRKAAAAVRMKAYKDRLTEVTKTGDFNRALGLKARVDQLETEKEGEPTKTTKRPRPKETVKFQGHTYALIKEPATWHVAKQRCEEMGGHLVCLEDPKEVEFIVRLAGPLVLWTGASDEFSEGDWRWVTGRAMTGLTIEIRPDSEAHFLVFDRKWLNGRSGTRCAYVCEWE